MKAKKTLSVLIAVIMAVGILAGCDNGSQSQSNTPPQSSTTQSTAPGSTAPESTAPASNTPASNTPASTAPSSTTPSATSQTSQEPSPPPPAAEIKVGISLALTDDFTENLRGIYERMAPEYGLSVSFTNAGGDVSNQIANVEALIAQRPDVIILRCVDGDIGNTLTEMVKDAGIPVIIDETKPNISRDYNVNVAGNQFIHGYLIGEWLQDYLDANPDVTLNMLYINGGTSDNIRRRMNGIFVTCTSDRLNLIGDELGSWSASTAQEITEAYLTSHPEMNIIAAANDEMALGVIETLKGAGKLNDIMVFGVDGSQSGQASIKAGELTGTTLNDVSISVEVIYEVAVMLANGQDVSPLFTDIEDKEIDPKAFILLTSENIARDGTY